jgi:hypothetical protein
VYRNKSRWRPWLALAKESQTEDEVAARGWRYLASPLFFVFFPVSRPQCRNQDCITVKLNFVGPIWSLGKVRNKGALHRRDELGSPSWKTFQPTCAPSLHAIILVIEECSGRVKWKSDRQKDAPQNERSYQKENGSSG